MSADGIVITPLRILIVEDDEGLSLLMTDRLEGIGAICRQARSGQEAIHELSKEAPDLVLLDYSLPDMTNLELLDKVKIPPFIVVTGQGDERVAVEMMKRGAKDYLVKDFYFLEQLAANVLRVTRELDTERKLAEAERTRKESEHRSEKLQSLLFEISEKSYAAKDMSEMYRAIHKIVGQLMQAQNFYIALFDKKNQRISFPYFVDRFDPPQQARGMQRGMTEYVLRTGQPVLADKIIFNALAELKEVELVGTQSTDWLGVPLKTPEDETFGVLVTQSYSNEPTHTEKDKEILVYASQQIATAILRKKAEEELRTTEEQFQQLQKAETIGTLVSSIAHDYNNILTAIMGNAQLLELQLQEEGSGGIPYVKAIVTAAENAAGMVRQLLTYSRKDEPAPVAQNINRLITDWYDVLRRVVEERTTLQTKLSSSLDLVLADPGKIKQVLMNLVLNAKDAMPQGGSITIETDNIELVTEKMLSSGRIDPGKYVRVLVADQGTGISPEYLQRIFDPFYTTKPRGRGTGLGLSIVKRIVEKLRGAIHVESAPGEGTVFQFYLPALDSREEDEPALPSISFRPISCGKGRRILVVEDEEQVREVVRKSLQLIGYQVFEAADGQSALNVLQKGAEVDLVLTDIKMPIMDGVELLHYLHEIHPELHERVFAMTAYSDYDPIQLQRLGFRKILFKPLSVRDLADIFTEETTSPDALLAGKQ